MITQEYLKSVLCYDPILGTFIWLIDKAKRSPKGNFAGSINNEGYLMISIDNKTYAAHNLAWLYIEGEYPPEIGYQVDHRDLNKLNNKWNNYRLSTISENQMNRTLQSNNKSGCKGVYWDKRKEKWRAQIGVNKIRITLGEYFTKDEAVQARLLADEKYHGEYKRNDDPITRN